MAAAASLLSPEGWREALLSKQRRASWCGLSFPLSWRCCSMGVWVVWEKAVWKGREEVCIYLCWWGMIATLICLQTSSQTASRAAEAHKVTVSATTGRCFGPHLCESIQGNGSFETFVQRNQSVLNERFTVEDVIFHGVRSLSQLSIFNPSPDLSHRANNPSFAALTQSARGDWLYCTFAIVWKCMVQPKLHVNTSPSVQDEIIQLCVHIVSSICRRHTLTSAFEEVFPKWGSLCQEVRFPVFDRNRCSVNRLRLGISSRGYFQTVSASVCAHTEGSRSARGQVAHGSECWAGSRLAAPVSIWCWQFTQAFFSTAPGRINTPLPFSEGSISRPQGWKCGGKL